MAKKQDLPYRKGTWFLVPLRTGGYARGLVARMDGNGGVFGYFFGPLIGNQCEASLPLDTKPEDALLVGRFGDLGLLNGTWPVLGESEGWKEEEWKMPPFVRVDEHEGKAFLSIYDESTFECVSEGPCDPALVEQYPYDRDMGYGAVEIRLTKLLSPTKA